MEQIQHDSKRKQRPQQELAEALDRLLEILADEVAQRLLAISGNSSNGSSREMASPHHGEVLTVTEHPPNTEKVNQSAIHANGSTTPRNFNR